VVQIWSGQTVTCLHTISPGHIWTTLYINKNFGENFINILQRIECFLGSEVYTEYCSRNESGMAWLIAGILQLRGIRRNIDKGRCPLCLGEENMKRVLQDWKETNHWRLKLTHDKWLNMNKQVVYRKKSENNKVNLQNLGKYLDIVKNINCLIK
jgi:hypothetical protein